MRNSDVLVLLETSYGDEIRSEVLGKCVAQYQEIKGFRDGIHLEKLRFKIIEKSKKNDNIGTGQHSELDS